MKELTFLLCNPQLDPSNTNLVLYTFNRFPFLLVNLIESHAVHCPQKTSIGKIQEGVFNESYSSPHTAAELWSQAYQPKMKSNNIFATRIIKNIKQFRQEWIKSRVNISLWIWEPVSKKTSLQGNDKS